jgi:putative PIN family toxin of toxin-antitoxin system
MNVVADTNVVVSAIFWPGESRECIALWARRRFHLAVSVAVLEEYNEVADRLARRHGKVNPEPWLQWIERRARVYEPAPLGHPRSRDPEDDPFLACALACGARFLISKDKDLLALEKPFGIQILHPRQFLAHFNKRAIRRCPRQR